jgi:hypothetical protein
MELIRKMVLAIEDAPTGFAPRNLAVDGYTPDQIGYHGCLMPGHALVVALFLDEQLVKECPRCIRRIDSGARICGYCGHDFTAHSQLRVDNFR